MHTGTVFIIKLVHSLIFFFMVACLGWIFYCALTRRYDWTLAVALGAVFLEGLALLLNRFECPLTTLTNRLAHGNGGVTELFLPRWLSRNTFKVAVVVVIIELAMLAFGYFRG